MFDITYVISNMIEKNSEVKIMQCIKTIFVVEIVSCFLDVFFKSPKFISILHIPQTIPLFQSNYILSSFDFCSVHCDKKSHLTDAMISSTSVANVGT